MIFSNKPDNENYNICIDGININRVTVCKFIGVLVDERLLWHDQIDSVCRKISKKLYNLHLVTTPTLSLYCILYQFFQTKFKIQNTVTVAFFMSFFQTLQNRT